MIAGPSLPSILRLSPAETAPPELEPNDEPPATAGFVAVTLSSAAPAPDPG